MTPAFIKRLVYRYARYLHRQDVARNWSAGSKKGWATRKAIRRELENPPAKELA